jgi:hypothetical protein
MEIILGIAILCVIGYYVFKPKNKTELTEAAVKVEQEEVPYKVETPAPVVAEPVVAPEVETAPAKKPRAKKPAAPKAKAPAKAPAKKAPAKAKKTATK